ncbi:MAG: glycosyltransferase family 39 protein [Bdellovibrionales bacterium]|nr:glycosyltransferase family 39 protein [Bdellovibrionales bacterium]
MIKKLSRALQTLGGLWVLSLVAKLIIGTIIPFFSDENYYWVWSLDPQLSYYDHPGAVAWMFWLGRLFGEGAQIERWPFILLTHLALLPWAALLKEELDSDQMKHWMLLVLLAPMPGLSALMSTPDVPLLFFWGLGTWFFHRALRSRALLDYFGFGAAVGLGFCSKYHIVLLPLCAAIYLSVKPKNEHRTRIEGILLAAFCFFIFSAPVWIWNSQHHFDSFTFQLKHGLGDPSFSLENPLIYIGGQLLLIFPTLVPFFLKESSQHKRHWLTIWAGVPVVFFLLTSIKGRVEPNWAIPAYTAVFALVARSPISFRHIKNVLLTWGTAATLVFFAILMPNRLMTFEWAKKSRLKEINQYDILVPVARSYEPFFASSYQMASTLSYTLNRRVCKLSGMGRRDHFDYLPECKPQGPFFIVIRMWDRFPEWALGRPVLQRMRINPEFELIEMGGP